MEQLGTIRWRLSWSSARSSSAPTPAASATTRLRARSPAWRSTSPSSRSTRSKPTCKRSARRRRRHVVLDLVLARTLVTQHGVGSLWRGVGVAASACGPAHALMFGTYEHVLTLGGQESAGADRAAVVGAVAGGVSTLAHDLVMVPADTIKQRMQLGYYRSAFHCLSRMLATGGGSLYRSLPTTLAMNVLYASLMMMANEGARKVVNPSGEYSLTTFLLCGGFSGAFAAALTTPLDVVKTRLQTQGLGVGVEAAAEAAAHDAPSAFTVRYSGFLDAATALWRCDGLRGFFRGATPRVLMYGPACAISWVAYEGAKKAIVDAGF